MLVNLVWLVHLFPTKGKEDSPSEHTHTHTHDISQVLHIANNGEHKA